MHFGEHLMIDGYNGAKDKLNDKEIVLRALIELSLKTGMRALSPPEVFSAPGNDAKDPGGWSGFVVIQESHISMHTFPLRGFLSADIYSCKNNLDIEYFTKYIEECFGLKDVEVNFVKRGTRYPKSNIY